MYYFLFSNDPKQALRMFRHLSAVLALLGFTIVVVYFYHYNLYSVDKRILIAIIILFWAGELCFTVILRSGLNKKYYDPSLTVPQLLWATLFLLTIVYLLNGWRGLMLIGYFGMLSFGYFKLRFREFLSVSVFVVFGYSLIIAYLFLYEPQRIDIEFELLQLLAFVGTITVMLYTGSSIHRLRERAKKQYIELQEALIVNRELAISDELTTLHNRRHFMDILDQQKALSERNNTDFVLCFCDLDRFKRINDTFGHHTGDMVLQQFSKILKNCIREIDFAARFGGEEFVCLLVDTDMNNANKVAERIRKSIANFNFNDIAPALHATVSIGIANFKQYNTIQETMMSADNRMYLAKRLGRNKVVSSDEDKESNETESV